MKVLNVIFKILRGFVVAFGAVSVVLILVLPTVFHVTPRVVISGSMEPLIKTGSMAWFNDRDTDVKVNDIVAYRLAENTYVTHRVIDAQDGYYITKGDANETEDLAPVTQEQIAGTYLFSIPYAGIAKAEINTHPVLAIPILGFAIVICAMSELLEENVKKSKRKHRIKTVS